MQQNILVTGATGMVGSELIRALKEKGANVSVLSRNPQRVKGFKAYHWDVSKQQIDGQCMVGADTVIHLAGEPIGDKWWTTAQKKQIVNSRVQSAHLLYQAIRANGNQVKNFISASAIGYYGDRGDELLTEERPAGDGFVADCCVKWEAAADEGHALDLRIVKIRTGIVLGKDKGSLPVMAKPIKLFAGIPLGSGDQWISWIHHEDITGIFLKVIFEPALNGAFNGCAPLPVTNKDLTHQVARALHRPVWPFSIPKQVLKLILGEKSILPLMSGKASAQKIIDAGYRFKYNTIEEALGEIYK